jgi:C4-dicarboxylate-specific signal transduction histidine kinase
MPVTSAWRQRLGRSAIVCVCGSLAMAALAYVCFALGFHLASAGFSLLIILALLSLNGRFFDLIVLSVVGIFCLNYLFVQPVFSFRMESAADIPPIAAFLITSLIITALAARTRRKADEELRQTQAALARFARVAILGELTASIAHEVNQPLSGAVSSANACLRWLAAEPPNVERAKQSVTRIVRDTNRAAEVVHRVRGLIKNSPPQRAALDINEAILEVTALSRNEIERNEISLVTQFSGGLTSVLADRIQIQQVFLNLIGNAIEALKSVSDRRRELVISTEHQPDGALATIKDNGAGLQPDKLTEIFKAFYTTKAEGIGMGLAISRSIVEVHGGRLWAEPGAPRGAAFHLTLPLAKEETS